MKTRDQLYGQEATSILRDISMYRALTKEQILGLYPGKKDKVENLLSYLVKQGRICSVNQYYCPNLGSSKNVDADMQAALWVLIDFIDRVEYHSSGDFPTKIIFFADGEIYEIIHASTGKEVLFNYILSDSCEEPSKYLILVDKPEQIEELQIPNVAGYCTVSPDGTVQYYQKE